MINEGMREFKNLGMWKLDNWAITAVRKKTGQKYYKS